MRIFITCLFTFLLALHTTIYYETCNADVLSKIKNTISTTLKVNTYNKIETELLKNGIKDYIAGRVVIKNERIFKPDYKDALGRSNCSRMIQGLAPIGIDDLPVNLHHMQQKNDGEIVEILDSKHKYFSGELHSYKRSSEINRQEFNDWKKTYWRERGSKICK